jgi:hypothetical protein
MLYKAALKILWVVKITVLVWLCMYLVDDFYFQSEHGDLLFTAIRWLLVVGCLAFALIIFKLFWDYMER